MADETQTGPGTGDCFACRGTGQVISNLGGEARTVPCPWCEGTGLRRPGRDAQARWREAAADRGTEPAAIDGTGVGVG
jgi:hypothetical protein